MKKNILFITLLVISISCGVTKKDKIKNYNNSFKSTTFNKSSVLWKIDLSTSLENNFSQNDLSAPVIIDEDKLIFANGKRVYTVNYNNGSIISKKKIPYSVMSPIVKVDKNLIFFASDGMIHLVNQNFDKIWDYKLDFEKVIGSFNITDSILFKTSKDKIYSLSKDGKLNWMTESYLSEFMPLLSDNKLLIIDNNIFAGFTNGRFIIIDKKDGKTIYEKTLSTNENFNDIIAAPIEKDGIIYIPSFAKGIIAFDSKNRELLWNTKLSTISSLFSINNGSYYLNNNYLVKIDLKNGKIKDIYNFIANRVITSSLFKNRYVVITSSKDGVIILDIKEKSSFTVNISSGLSNEPIFIENDMILLSNNGVLYRIKLLLK